MRTVCRVRVSSALTYWSLLAHGRSLVCSSRAKFWTLPRRRSDQASQRTKLTRSYTTRPSSATPIRPRWDIGTIPNPCARTSAPAPMPSVSCRQPFNFFLHAALRSVNEAICHGILTSGNCAKETLSILVRSCVWHAKHAQRIFILMTLLLDVSVYFDGTIDPASRADGGLTFHAQAFTETLMRRTPWARSMKSRRSSSERLARAWTKPSSSANLGPSSVT